MGKQPLDEQNITDYLLGATSEAETERLDEISLTDDAFAQRLRTVENDLVDAYVRRELSGYEVAGFESHYLASSRRREKVAFAEAFLNVVDRLTTAQAKEATIKTSLRRPGWFSFLAAPSPALQWGLAAVALVILLGGGYLMVENLRLRNQMEQAQAERGELEQRERELQRQLAEQRSSDAETEKELARVRDELAQLEQVAGDEQRGNANQRDLKIIAFNLAPQTRGIGQIRTLVVPPGTDYVALTLELETDAFPAFRAALKNPATGQIVWRSGKVKPGGRRRTLRVRLPASLLNAQNYLVELSGVSSDGVAEIVSSYPFRVGTQ